MAGLVTRGIIMNNRKLIVIGQGKPSSKLFRWFVAYLDGSKVTNKPHRNAWSAHKELDKLLS
jgi:predicted RNA-binding protein YlxR (DUF448 family)